MDINWVKISYIHTQHIKVYVVYPYDLNQADFFLCLTLLYPAFVVDVNINHV